jgi:antitoxin ParD1/3/4
MKITLTADQLAWIEAHVQTGEFASVDDAVRQLVDERIADRGITQTGDLAWAMPYVDEALKAVAEGRVMTLEDHNVRIAAFVKSLQG